MNEIIILSYEKTFTKEIEHQPLMELLKTENEVIYREPFVSNDILFRKNYLINAVAEIFHGIQSFCL